MPKAVLPLACALALAGCSSTIAGTADVPKCSGDQAFPISTEAVVDALRSQGLMVEPQEESGNCLGDVVAALTNDELSEDEGHAICSIYREPHWGSRLQMDLDARPYSSIVSGGRADFWLSNVTCSIYPSGEAKSEQVARLQQAIETLEGPL